MSPARVGRSETGAAAAGRKIVLPLLVPVGLEFNGGAGADVVGGGGQTRDTYKDDCLDILELDADKQLK